MAVSLSLIKSLRLIEDGKLWRTPQSLPVTFGNGEFIEENILNSIVAIAYHFTTLLEWKKGDVALVDNRRVMHGRHPYSGVNKREVLVSLARDS